MKHLAQILKAAKDRLEYGHEIHYNRNTSIYICRAIEKAALADTVDEAHDATTLINSRLGSYPTAKTWKWPNSCTTPFTEVQAFRHAWLDALILECETGVRDPNFPAEDLKT
jgi:hypothetical protein